MLSRTRELIVKPRERQAPTALEGLVREASAQLARDGFDGARYHGSGGSSLILRAYETDEHRDVAVRVPLPQELLKSKVRREIERRGDIAERLKRSAAATSPLASVPTVFYSHSIGLQGRPTRILVEQFVDGVSLKEFLQDNGPLRTDEARPILRTLCDTLARLHEDGLYHLDLNLGNVLITPKRDTVLIDFGFAERRIDTASPRELLSTLDTTSERHVTPPEVREQLRTRKRYAVTPKLDVFGLGAVGFCLFTGDYPYRGGSRDEVAARMRRATTPGAPQFLRPLQLRLLGVPKLKGLDDYPDLQEALYRAIDHEDYRQSSVAELRAQLEHGFAHPRPDQNLKRNLLIAAPLLALSAGITAKYRQPIYDFMTSGKDRVLRFTDEKVQDYARTADPSAPTGKAVRDVAKTFRFGPAPEAPVPPAAIPGPCPATPRIAIEPVPGPASLERAWREAYRAQEEGRLHEAKRRLEIARRVHGKTLPAQPNGYRLLLLEGLITQQLDDEDEALRILDGALGLYDRARRQHPKLERCDGALLHERLAQGYLARGRRLRATTGEPFLDLARRHAQGAIDADPKNESYRKLAADILAATKQQ